MFLVNKKYDDLYVGYKINRLTLLSISYRKDYSNYWLCKCDCGKEKVIIETNIKNGHTKSCGCFQHEVILKVCRNRHTKNFEDWCIENKLNDVLDLWDYSLNNLNPSDVSYKTNKPYWFMCPNGKHKSELHRLDNFCTYYKKYGTSIKCSECNSFAEWGFKNVCNDFLEKYWCYEKNVDVDPYRIDFASNDKVWIKCQEKDYHESYQITCGNFIYGKRCPYCARNTGKIHYLDSLGKVNDSSVNIWSSLNIKTPFDFGPFSNKTVYWKCENNIHDDYKYKINNMNKLDFHCPECLKLRKESHLQEKVRTYLQEKCYNVLTEFSCNLVPHSPKTNKCMPYDNEIPELRLIIEVHGEQHYNSKCAWHKRTAKKYNITEKEAFKLRKLHDRYKKYVAYANGYEYLEIPWYTESDESYKYLVDNKITQILQGKAPPNGGALIIPS